MVWKPQRECQRDQRIERTGSLGNGKLLLHRDSETSAIDENHMSLADNEANPAPADVGTAGALPAERQVRC